jgi:hypothetical protein
MNFEALTKGARPSSITGVQVCRPRWSAKRESGAIGRLGDESNPELPPQLSAASPTLCAKLGKAEKGYDPRVLVLAGSAVTTVSIQKSHLGDDLYISQRAKPSP